MAGFFSRLFGLEDKADFKTLLENGATLLDVRTKEEYKQGAVANSINIPLDSLSNNLSKLKRDKPVIAVCASGMRSRNAVAILRTKGFPEVYNGGSWTNFYMKQTMNRIRTKRTIFLFSLVTLLLTSCNCKAETKNQTIETTKKENKMRTIHLTKAEFLSKVANFEANPTQWNYLGDKPALIDFYADWCGPCKAIAPVLEELAAEYEGSVYIYKINTETEPELAAAFGIRSIPTLLFVPMKGQPQMATGALPKKQLKEAIDNVLLKE